MSVEPTGADLRGFADVDAVPEADAASLFRSLDEGKKKPAMQAIQAELREMLHLDGAEAVLDVGCGLGTDTLELASLLPRRTRIVGLDLSTRMVEEARRRAGAAAHVEFVVGSAADPPFGEAEFDRCRMQSVLQHVGDPEEVVAHLARLTRPGGRVGLLEFDHGTAVLDHPDRFTTRLVLDAVTDAALQGWVGRQLPRLLRRAGFTAIDVRPRLVLFDFPYFTFAIRRPLAQFVRDGVLTGRSAVEWMRQIENLDRKGDFFGGSTAFLVAATRP